MLILRILQNAQKNNCCCSVTEFSHLLHNINLDKFLVFCSASQVWALSLIYDTLSWLLTVSELIWKKSYSGWLSSITVSLRTTRWKVHSDQAGKGTFPQLQGKLATTNFIDHRTDFVFRIHFYGSWSLAGKKTRTLRVQYVLLKSSSKNSRPIPFPQSIHMLKACLFFLKLQNTAHMGSIELSNTHKRGDHPLNWASLGFFFWQIGSYYQCIWTPLKSLYLFVLCESSSW